jgi:hypothetical protein
MKKEKHYKFDKIVSIFVSDFKKNPHYEYIEYVKNFWGKKKFIGKLKSVWSFNYMSIDDLDKTLTFNNNQVYYKPHVVIDFVNKDSIIKWFESYEEALEYRDQIKDNKWNLEYFKIDYDNKK